MYLELGKGPENNVRMRLFLVTSIDWKWIPFMSHSIGYIAEIYFFTSIFSANKTQLFSELL